MGRGRPTRGHQMAKKLGERLVEAGLVTAEMVEQALQHQKVTGHRLGDCLVEIGLLQETALLRFLASELNTRYVSADKLAKVKIPTEVLDRVPVRMAEQQVFLPIAIDPEQKLISIVSAEPQNTVMLDEIKVVTGMDEVYAYVALRSAILAAIKKHYYGDPTAFAQLEREGVASLRQDVSAMTRAYESARTESKPSPGLHLSFDSDPRARTSIRGSTSVRPLPPQLRDALSVVRGSLGDNDYVETLNILVGLLELTRKDLRGHSGQLARQASIVARKMGLPPREVSQVRIAAYLHDLAKRPDRHFSLASNAHSPEWKTEAKRYVRAPIRLFETVHLPGAVNAMLAQLYEAYDGSGTPQGARGDEIAAGARILAAVDSYIDLTKNHQNAYGRVFSKEEALEHMRQGSGVLYDPVVVDLLERLLSGELLRQRLESEGRQVLVADPDEATRTDLLEALSRRGLVVHTVARLEGVVDALLSGEADVLVIGLRFGINDLATLVQFVRAQPECAGLPVVVLGEPPDLPSRERLAQSGTSVTIPMPLDPDEAAKTIEQLYRQRIEEGGPGHVVGGSYDELPPLELLKLLGHGRKSGRLTVRNGTQDAHIYLERGRVVFAQYASQSGEAAIESVVGLTQAEFSYDPEAVLLELPHMDKDLEVIVRRLERAQST